MKKAIYAGSFDPFTKGHADILSRAIKIFDHVTLLIAVSPLKKPLFSVEQRLEMLKVLFEKEKKVSVDKCSGLLIDYANANSIQFFVRGLRTTIDFDIENQMAMMNHKLDAKIETVFLASRSEFAHLSSTLVRDIHSHGGDVSLFLPEKILSYIQSKN